MATPIKTKNAATVYLSSWVKGSDSYTTHYKSLAAIADVLGGDDPESFDWGSLRYDDVRAIPAKLAERPKGKTLKPNTVNKALSALRGVLEAAYRLAQLPEDEYRRIGKVKNVRGRSLPAGRTLSAEEMDVLVTVINKALDFNGANNAFDARGVLHDAAVMAVLAGAGLRRVELARLVVADYKDGRITAYGKGNKARTIPVGKRFLPVIEAWWRLKTSGAHPMQDLLFDLPGKDPRRRVSYIVESFCALSSFRPFTPHDLRRTFGTHVESVAGIAVAQKLLGHESVQTTGLYVRVNEARENAAVEGL